MCDNSTLVNSTTGLASASAILNACARVVLCVFLLSFVFSSPFFCVPFLFRVLVNPKRFFFLLFCPFFRSPFHTKVLTYFCKDDDARRRRGGRERDAVESSRWEESSRLSSLFLVFFSRWWCCSFVLSFFSLFFLILNFREQQLTLFLSLSLLPPRFRIIKPLLSRNNNENESNSQRKLAHARLSRRRGFFLLGNVRPSDWIVQTERLPGRHRVRLEKSVRRSSEKNDSSGVDVEFSR